MNLRSSPHPKFSLADFAAIYKICKNHQMQILIVIIEKDGKNYIGRSPNLLGVSVSAKTRDEAETLILDAMEKRIKELDTRHNSRSTISTLPIEETISCLFKFKDKGRKGKCSHPAQKEGLCQYHWKKIYGHETGFLKSCPLCGESDKEVLKKWGSPCQVKTETPNWPDLLEEKRRTMKAEWKKERAELKLEKLGDRPRCTRILANGEQCYREQEDDGLCFNHYLRKKMDKRYS